MIDRGERSKTLSEVKPVEKISKNLQSFLEISPVQKEVLYKTKVTSHRKIARSIESSKFLSHRGRMSGEFDSRKDSQSTKFKQMPQIFVKLSFRELQCRIIWFTCF